MRVSSASSHASSSSRVAAAANGSFSSSASGRPRQSSTPRARTSAACAGSPCVEVAPARATRVSKRRRSSWSGVDREHVARGARDEQRRRPRWCSGSSSLRRRDTCACKAVCASPGGCSPQISSIRRSLETTSPWCSSRTASSAFCLTPPRRSPAAARMHLQRAEDPEIKACAQEATLPALHAPEAASACVALRSGARWSPYLNRPSADLMPHASANWVTDASADGVPRVAGWAMTCSRLPTAVAGEPASSHALRNTARRSAACA